MTTPTEKISELAGALAEYSWANEELWSNEDAGSDGRPDEARLAESKKNLAARIQAAFDEWLEEENETND